MNPTPTPIPQGSSKAPPYATPIPQASREAPQKYEATTYVEVANAPWCHLLYGHVPSHQQDVLCRPQLPHGELSFHHYTHAQRLVRNLDPRSDATVAFAIANLSMDDSQHRAGEGALAIAFSLRLQRVTDHVGRRGAVFAHAILSAGLPHDGDSLLSALLSLERGLSEEGPSFYREYYSMGQQNAPGAYEGYLRGFRLPGASKSERTAKRWYAPAQVHNPRVLIRYAAGTPFGDLAKGAAQIAGLLYRSDLKWVAISTGCEESVLRNSDSVYLRLVRDFDEATPEGALCLELSRVLEMEEGELAAVFGLSEATTAEVPPPREERSVRRQADATKLLEKDALAAALVRDAQLAFAAPEVPIQQAPPIQSDIPTTILQLPANRARPLTLASPEPSKVAPLEPAKVPEPLPIELDEAPKNEVPASKKGLGWLKWAGFLPMLAAMYIVGVQFPPERWPDLFGRSLPEPTTIPDPPPLQIPNPTNEQGPTLEAPVPTAQPEERQPKPEPDLSGTPASPPPVKPPAPQPLKPSGAPVQKLDSLSKRIQFLKDEAQGYVGRLNKAEQSINQAANRFKALEEEAVRIRQEGAIPGFQQAIDRGKDWSNKAREHIQHGRLAQQRFQKSIGLAPRVPTELGGAGKEVKQLQYFASSAESAKSEVDDQVKLARHNLEKRRSQGVHPSEPEPKGLTPEPEPPRRSQDPPATLPTMDDSR